MQRGAFAFSNCLVMAAAEAAATSGGVHHVAAAGQPICKLFRLPRQFS